MDKKTTMLMILDGFGINEQTQGNAVKLANIPNLNKILSENTGQNIEKIANDTERDNFMDAEEALKYGLVDKILNKN